MRQSTLDFAAALSQIERETSGIELVHAAEEGQTRSGPTIAAANGTKLGRIAAAPSGPGFEPGPFPDVVPIRLLALYGPTVANLVRLGPRIGRRNDGRSRRRLGAGIR